MKTIELNFQELELAYKLILGGEQQDPSGAPFRYLGLMREDVTLGVRHRLMKILKSIHTSLVDYEIDRNKLKKEIWGDNPPLFDTKEHEKNYYETTEEGKAIVEKINMVFVQKKKIEFEPLHFSKIENEKFNTDYTFLVENFFDDTK